MSNEAAATENVFVGVAQVLCCVALFTAVTSSIVTTEQFTSSISGAAYRHGRSHVSRLYLMLASLLACIASPIQRSSF